MRSTHTGTFYKKSRQMTSSFFQSRMKYGFFLQKYRKIRVIIEEQEKYA